jgi:hypothetical protein
MAGEAADTDEFATAMLTLPPDIYVVIAVVCSCHCHYPAAHLRSITLADRLRRRARSGTGPLLYGGAAAKACEGGLNLIVEESYGAEQVAQTLVQMVRAPVTQTAWV